MNKMILCYAVSEIYMEYNDKPYPSGVVYVPVSEIDFAPSMYCGKARGVMGWLERKFGGKAKGCSYSRDMVLVHNSKLLV